MQSHKTETRIAHHNSVLRFAVLMDNEMYFVEAEVYFVSDPALLVASAPLFKSSDRRLLYPQQNIARNFAR